MQVYGLAGPWRDERVPFSPLVYVRTDDRLEGTNGWRRRLNRTTGTEPEKRVGAQAVIPLTARASQSAVVRASTRTAAREARKAVWERIAFFSVLALLITLANSSLVSRGVGELWSETAAQRYSKFVQAGTPGFVAALLIGIYIDIIRGRANQRESQATVDYLDALVHEVLGDQAQRHDELVATVRREPLNRADPRELIETGIRRALKTDEGIHNLVSLTVGRTVNGVTLPPIHACDVEHSLSDASETPGFFAVHRVVTCQTRLPRYILALCCSDEIAQAFTYDCPEVFDTWNVESQDALVRNRQSHLDHTVISYQRPNKQGDFSVRCEARLKEVTELAEINNLLGLELKTRDDLVVFCVELPGDRAQDRVTIDMEVLLPQTVNYVFWSADCPTFLEQVRFNVTDFKGAAGGKSRTFTLIPFLGCTDDMVTSSADSSTLSVTPHNWVAKGHGALLTWNES